MAAGYELTELRPGAGEYKEVPSAVRPILDYIFTDGFPHSIEDVRTKLEFCGLLLLMRLSVYVNFFVDYEA